MNCQKCNSERVLNYSGKCSDMFFGNVGNKEIDGYVPDDANIGGGDYLKGKLCLDCGQMQGTFPVPPMEFEMDILEEDQEENEETEV